MGGFEDKIIYCVDCGKDFVWNAKEQIYYSQRNLNEPKRCASCRLKKRQRNAQMNRY